MNDAYLTLADRWRFRDFCQPQVRVRLVTPPDVEQIALDDAYRHLRLTPVGSPLVAHPDDEWLQGVGIPTAREEIEDETGRSLAPQTFEAYLNRWPRARQHGPVRAPFIELPGSPIIEIESIAYVNVESVADEALPTVAASDTYDLAQASGEVNTDVWSLVLVDSADPPLTLEVDTDYTLDRTANQISFLGSPGTQPYLASYTRRVERVMAAELYTLDNFGAPGLIYPSGGETWPTITNGQNAVRIRYLAGYSIVGASPQPHPLPKVLQAAMLLVLGDRYENREATTDQQLAELPRGVAALVRKHKIDLGMA